LIFYFQSNLDEKIFSRPWLKNDIFNPVDVEEWSTSPVHIRLTFYTRTLIKKFSADSD